MIPKLVLPLTGYPYNYIAHFTENPVQEIWNYLLFFADLSFLRNAWKQEGVTPASEDLSFVSTSIRQSYEYFQAGQTTTLTTRPLLLYYSMLNLAKAVITIRKDNRAKKHHGLGDFKEADDLFDLSACTRNGVFLELAELLGASWVSSKEKKFSFADFCLSNIDIGYDVFGHYGRTQRCAEVGIEILSDGHVYLHFSKSGPADSSNLKEILDNRPEFKTDFSLESETSSSLKYKNNFTVPDGLSLPSRDVWAPILEKYFNFILRPGVQNVGYFDLNPSKEIIPQPCTFFGMLFLLGSAVRYAPDKLAKWLYEEQHSKVWLLDLVCQLSARTFPNYMLNILLGKTHRFAPTF